MTVYFYFFVVKDGTPQNAELEELAFKIAARWRTLGRRLKFNESLTQEIDKTIEETTEKAYQMLLHWKRREGPAATYQVLYDALMHPLVDRRDMAEKLCFNQ